MAGSYSSTLNTGINNTFTLYGMFWNMKMMVRYTFLGVSTVVIMGLMAGQATADGGFQVLDLKSIVNMDWRDEVWGDGRGGWTDQGDNDMRQISVGMRQLLGIPFELIDPARNGGKAVLTLGSKKFPAGPLSATARFGGKARSLYFLHAAAWSGGHMATYVVHYADGATAEIPIRDKEEIMNWWWPTHGAKYRAAIHVPNAQTDDVGLVVFGWDNPQPDKVDPRHRAQEPQRRRDRGGGGDHGLR